MGIKYLQDNNFSSENLSEIIYSNTESFINIWETIICIIFNTILYVKLLSPIYWYVISY